VARIVTQEELWSGNRESWRAQFASRDSLFVWAMQTHHRYRSQFASDLALPEYAHLALLRFRRPAATDAWLQEIGRWTDPSTLRI
jgi:hypothetical protein